MILSQQASGSQPLSPIPHRMAWLKSYAARLSILNPARSVKFLTLGRPSTRDRRGDLPQRVSTGFLSPHRCVQMLPKLIRQDIKKLLGFYKIVAGHVCAQLGGKNIILLETIVQVQQAVRWNRNVSMLSLDTAGIFKTTFLTCQLIISALRQIFNFVTKLKHPKTALGYQTKYDIPARVLLYGDLLKDRRSPLLGQIALNFRPAHGFPSNPHLCS